MSWSLANEKKIIAQFATITGLADLRAASKGPAMRDFFEVGATKNIAACRRELAAIATGKTRKDIRSTARGLARLMKGQTIVSLTMGAGYD